MSLIIVNAAEETHLTRILGPDMLLKLFKNHVVNGLTAGQIEALDETDFTEADFTGYADFEILGTLDPHTDWVITPDDPTEAVEVQHAFASTADQTPQNIYGYYVVTESGGALEWFEYFDPSTFVPQVIENDGDTIRVTPKFTYRDEQDS